MEDAFSDACDAWEANWLVIVAMLPAVLLEITEDIEETTSASELVADPKLSARLLDIAD